MGRFSLLSMSPHFRGRKVKERQTEITMMTTPCPSLLGVPTTALSGSVVGCGQDLTFVDLNRSGPLCFCFLFFLVFTMFFVVTL